MHAPAAAPTRLADYRPPGFLIDRIDLTVALDPARTIVRARLAVRRNPASGQTACPLALDAEALSRGPILLDGAPLDPARLRETPTGIEIEGIGEQAELDIETIVAPEANSEFSGLYLSGGNYVTQCEAEGFRRITCFADRPDVMARFTTTLIADRASCPVLLSNGNRVDGGLLDDGRHWAKWEDPHPKPCYLFALVAGDLVCVRDSFTTRSGRTIALGIHVRRSDADQCLHAMQVLKQSMRWDEDVFGLEYDLDAFNIAAVSDFNMGAMENKGLNVFNTKYVLARPETATDADYQGIETVIAHEYFHNWTGNRVTCRDWFQLSLKEGLTVFRDQEFSADQGSRAVKRIADVRRLRASQFPEDGGPLAHPVRPDSYVKIDNFYTATVYQKGAELVRMIRTLIGPRSFRAGMDLYIARHDNQAVTIEDFCTAMQDASGEDLAPFRTWYSQAGTPEITATERYDAGQGRYTLTLRQHTPPTPNQPDKAPLLMPIAMGLLDADGTELPTRLEADHAPQHGTRILRLSEAEQSFVFVGLVRQPTVSLLRDFSAPVKLAAAPPASLRLLAAHDPDPFVRWESGQRYATGLMLGAIAATRSGDPIAVEDGLIGAIATLLREADADPGFAAEALSLPGEAFLADQMGVVDVEAIHAVREAFLARIGQALRAAFAARYAALQDTAPYAPDGPGIARRALKNICLAYMCAAGDHAAAEAQYRHAANMTDRLAALALLNTTEGAARDAAFEDFRHRFADHDLVLDKWFALQAMSPLPGALAAVQSLTRHPDFSWRNPNRLRALVASFALANPVRFHAASGAGYRFLADAILQVDALNSQTAARLVTPLGSWRRHDPNRQDQMRAALQRLLDTPRLSAATREMAARSLNQAAP